MPLRLSDVIAVVSWQQYDTLALKCQVFPGNHKMEGLFRGKILHAKRLCQQIFVMLC